MAGSMQTLEQELRAHIQIHRHKGADWEGRGLLKPQVLVYWFLVADGHVRDSSFKGGHPGSVLYRMICSGQREKQTSPPWKHGKC